MSLSSSSSLSQEMKSRSRLGKKFTILKRAIVMASTLWVDTQFCVNRKPELSGAMGQPARKVNGKRSPLNCGELGTVIKEARSTESAKREEEVLILDHVMQSQGNKDEK